MGYKLSNNTRDKGWCHECGIGLNNREIDLCFCQNCKANWEPQDINQDDDE